jgi:hypothetical protein
VARKPKKSAADHLDGFPLDEDYKIIRVFCGSIDGSNPSFRTGRKPMETGTDKQGAAGTKGGIAEGTQEMGYWEFRKKFCAGKGWELRRIAPQTYEVLNSIGEKIGIFKSKEGYFPGGRRSSLDI